MATTLSITSNYAGEEAGMMISPALFSAPTLAEELISVNQNIAYKWNVVRISDDNFVSNGTCDFTDADTTTWTERVLTPEDFQVNREYCKTDFIPSWEAQQVAGSSAFKDIPRSFANYMLGYISEGVAEHFERVIWQGVDASAGEFDGFETLFAADSDVVDVTGSISDASGTEAFLEAGYEAIPKAIFRKPDLKMFVGLTVFRQYQEYLSTTGQGYLNQLTVGEKPLDYKGVPIHYCPGLSDNNFVIARTSNLWFGTSSKADFNKVQVLDMENLVGYQNFRMVARMRAGVQYGYGAEVVYGQGS